MGGRSCRCSWPCRTQCTGCKAKGANATTREQRWCRVQATGSCTDQASSNVDSCCQAAEALTSFGFTEGSTDSNVFTCMQWLQCERLRTSQPLNRHLVLSATPAPTPRSFRNPCLPTGCLPYSPLKALYISKKWVLLFKWSWNCNWNWNWNRNWNRNRNWKWNWN